MESYNLMKKRVIIVHGWGDNPNSNWYGWVKRELKKKGCDVLIPEMPESETPKIEAWVSALSESIGEVDENTYFIGHSIGCQTIMRYLEKLKNKVGGVVFVAGWFILQGIEDEAGAVEIAQPWIETPINLDKVRKNASEFTAIFSDNDYYVSPENMKIFSEKLGARIIVEKKKGHFTERDGVKTLATALSEMEKMLDKK